MTTTIRSIRDRRALVALLSSVGTLLALAACGGSDSTSPPPPAGDTWATVVSAPYSIVADAEGYKCFVAQVATDQYITGFRLASPSPVQAEVQISESETPITLGAFECTVVTHTGKLIYLSGTGTSAIEFPAGKGVHIAAGRYLLVNIHVTNNTSSLVQDSAVIEGRVGTAADVTTPLTMFIAGTLLIQIPADALPHTSTGGCTVNADQHIVAVIPLMRTRGTHQTVSLFAGSDTTKLRDAAFDPLHMSYTIFPSDVHVPVGGELRVECTYVNNTANTIGFGDAQAAETCFTGFYHYADDGTSSDIYSCANNSSPDIVHEEPLNRAPLRRVTQTD
jgi:hypothetical protein